MKGLVIMDAAKQLVARQSHPYCTIASAKLFQGLPENLTHNPSANESGMVVRLLLVAGALIFLGLCLSWVA